MAFDLFPINFAPSILNPQFIIILVMLTGTPA